MQGGLLFYSHSTMIDPDCQLSETEVWHACIFVVHAHETRKCYTAVLANNNAA
jgi:hypothetical protein